MKIGSTCKRQGLGMAAAVLAGCIGLVGCGEEDGEKAAKVGVTNQTTTSNSVPEQKTADDAVLKQIEDENKPQHVGFSDPGIGDAREYLDMRSPLLAFNLYNARRNWEESATDIADSVGDAFNARKANPELSRLGAERISSSDNFKKKDLADKIGALALAEANKVKDRPLVKFTSDEWVPVTLSGYDFEKKGFSVDNCLFSDKLSYTDDESRNSTSLEQAPKLRCYLNPGPVPYYIGFTGGSKVFFEIKDEAKARQIEAVRQNVKIDVYGYVQSVERERLGGNLGPQRWVLIAPQRIDVIDAASGNVLLTKTI
jgi:hypothetical protein